MPPSNADSSSESEAAFKAARDICRRHARSFYFASAFLKPEKRDASYAVYAFCRMLDDAIDQPGSDCSTDSLESRLAMFRDRLDEIYDKRLELPKVEFRTEEQNALEAFSRTVHRYEISKDYFVDLAEGCRMDLTVSRYATWASLEKYCYHVAGVVGLMMSCVFGLTHSDAKRHAVTMGNAMQLTNILRDVKEDWDRGRIYLPLEDMIKFRYSERELADGVVNTGFRELMRFEINRARKMYTQASEGLCWLAGDGSRLTASAMAVIYSGILDAIERQNYDVFSRRAKLGMARKVARIPKALRLAIRKPDKPVPLVFGAVD